MIRIRSPQDFGAAILFAVFGVVGLWFGRDYALGTPTRIGPGYVPALASWGLVAIGALLAARSAAFEGPKIEAGAWRPRLLILASILVFAGLIELTGLVVASVASMIVAGFATREARKGELVVLSVLFSVLCALMFVVALSQPMRLWGPR